MGKTREEWSKEVRIELIKRDMALKDLADKIMYSYSMVQKVVHGTGESPRIVMMIERVLGVEPYTEESND